MNISIIVTFYNNKNILNTCLSALAETLKNNSEHKIEVIIVNDNPQIDLASTQKSYKSFFELKVIQMKQNSGYSRACNEGVNTSKYEYILLMDCDIIPSGNWLEAMVETMSDINSKGCVSATIVDMLTNKIYGYGFGVYGVDTIHFLKNRTLSCCPSQDMDFPILSSGCLLMPKNLYVNAGGQDSTYLNAFNDFDLTYCLYKQHYYNRMSRNAIVFHRGHVAGNVRTNFYTDSKAYFFRKIGDKLDTITKENILKIYSTYNKLYNTKIIVANFSNSLFRMQYIEMFTELHQLEILQYYDFKNVTNNSIILNDYLTLDVCRINIPILYYVDSYELLKNNYFWFSNRYSQEDIVLDRHANILEIKEMI